MEDWFSARQRTDIFGDSAYRLTTLQKVLNVLGRRLCLVPSSEFL